MAQRNRSRAARRMLGGALGLAVAFAAAACAPTPQPGSQIGPATVHESKMGPVLADPSGMTLYIHKDDEKGMSSCYGRCARSWPPFLAAAGARPSGKFTVAPRKDGTRQWAYDGMPLYLWEKDKRPGDVTGQGYGDVWYAARP